MNFRKKIENQYIKIKDYFWFRFFWLRKQHGHQKPVSKTILIIRIDAIGDCIIWLDQAKEYRKAFPNHKLVLLHNKVWSEIAERLPWFDECIPFDRTKIADVEYYKSLIALINRYTYEKIFSPVFSRDLVTVDWLVHNINAKEKIGYEGDYHNNFWIKDNNRYVRKHKEKLDIKSIADSWYTYLVPNDSSCMMELQRNAHFVRCTMDSNFLSHLPSIPFDTQSSIITDQSDYAVIFLGASVVHRTWPIKNFAIISEHLPFQTLVLCGSIAEKQLADEFMSCYEGQQNIIDITGKTSLIDLIGIIAKGVVLISNETSASHIAVATHTPSICLLGGGHYGRFHPYHPDVLSDEERNILPIIITCKDHSCFGCNWNCRYPLINNRWRCIAEIRPEDVNDFITDNNR